MQLGLDKKEEIPILTRLITFFTFSLGMADLRSEKEEIS